MHSGAIDTGNLAPGSVSRRMGRQHLRREWENLTVPAANRQIPRIFLAPRFVFRGWIMTKPESASGYII
jgi:hypothetical protein